MTTRIRTPYLAATLALLLAACDSPVEPNLLSVPAVTLEAVGDSKQMEANVRGTQPLPTWESLNPQIATVTRAGMVTAVAPGTAILRATLGKEVAVGEVTVLPLVNVEITAATKAPSNHPGMDRVTLHIRNEAGRGYYRMRFYRESTVPGGEPQIISQMLTDLEIEAQQPANPFAMDVSSPAHWVVIYSRSPHSLEYRVTACARLDGEPGCPMP